MNTLRDLLKRPISFHPIFAKITGSVDAAIFLSQAYYWSERKESGWFYKTQADWQEETTLTRYEQESSRKKLKELGVLEEKRQGSPAKMHYRVITENLENLINEYARNSHFSMRETDNQECEKLTIKNARNSHTIKGTEITTETTAQDTSYEVKELHYELDDFSKPSSTPKKRTTKNTLRSEKDLRSKHPVIQFVKGLMSRYPDKVLWDRIIKRFGEGFDRDLLRECRASWVERGYNPNATTWLNWYFDGIPERKGNGRTNTNQNNSNESLDDALYRIGIREGV